MRRLIGVLLGMPLTVCPLDAQERPDTAAADSVIAADPLLVRVARPATTTGGASAVEARLDSVAVAPAPTLEQVLREMPLIVIRRNSRGEAQPALRGGEDRQIAVLVDGIPLTLGWDHRTDLSIIPLTAARQVTLVRGISSVLHGPNVLAGVIEVDINAGPGRQPPPEPLTINASVDHVGGSSFGVTGGTLLEAAGGQWVFRAGGGYRDRPGVPLPDDIALPTACDPAADPDCDGPTPHDLLTDDGDLRLNSDARLFDGFVSGRYVTESGRWLSLTASGYHGERGVAPEIHESAPRLWRYPSQSRMLAAFSAGTGQQETPWGTGDLEASVGVDVGSTEIDEYGTLGYDDVVGGESDDDRTITLRLLGDHTLGARADLRAAFTYADVSHDEVLQADGEPDEHGSYRQRLWSLGAETEWRLDRAGETRLSVGLALDGADTPESGDKPPLARLWDWGGRLGVTSLVGDAGAVQLHGGISRRARFPALRELYSGALGRFEPNPDLRPEILLSAEAGFTVHTAGIEFQAVGFHQRLQDAIARTSVDTPDGEKFKRVNQDEIRSTGLELLAGFGVGRLTATGDVTLQRVRLIDSDAGSDTRPEYEPAVSGRLGAQFELPARFTATGDLRFVSEQFCVSPRTGGQERVDPSATVDLGLRRVFSWATGGLFSQVEALLGVDNVAGAAVYDQCGLPQPGRALRLQLRLH